jgi:hypothetical protein
LTAAHAQGVSRTKGVRALTTLERTVMEMLLAGDDPELQLLRTQYASAGVAKREMSGVGFFTSFSVDHSLPGVTRPMWIQDVMAEATGVSDSIRFILWVNDGFIDTLEGWSSGDWPESEPELIRAYYLHRVAPDSPQLVEVATRDLVYALHDPYRTPAERQKDKQPGWWARALARLTGGNSASGK